MIAAATVSFSAACYILHENGIHAVAIAAPKNAPPTISDDKARALTVLLSGAAAEGLDSKRYSQALGQGTAGPMAKGLDNPRVQASLREAVLAYARDLRVPRGMPITYIDADLAPSLRDAEAAAASSDPASRLRGLQRLNPVYNGLRSGLDAYRRRWSKLPQVQVPTGEILSLGSRDARVKLLRQRLGVLAPTSDADLFDQPLGEAVRTFRAAHGLGPAPVADAATISALNLGSAYYERLIVANLDRARGLPIDGRRYILVDTAGATLWMIENGRKVGSMRVIVGKPGMETPELAAFIRFAVVNPYWNIPPDLVRTSVAPNVLAQGQSLLTQRRFVVFSDWIPSARRLSPDMVDWHSVADGRQKVWVRQLPGGDNMMGRVKFMLPNRLGIYLHDTPRKADFSRSDRRLSSGCVRLENASALADWIFNGRHILQSETPETRVDLPEPVPVFILYFTVFPQDGSLHFRPDVYHRDPALLAALVN